MKGRYVIYTPSFSDTNGGAIFLHGLADMLAGLGENAAVTPMAPLYRTGKRDRIRRFFRPDPFDTMPGSKAGVVSRREIGDDDIVVYPEIVPGNPLGARNVVRWLLYKPGVFHRFAPGPDEMFFAVGDFCDVPQVTGGAARLTAWRVHPAYRDPCETRRRGSCYMLRKGREKAIAHDLTDSVRLDGKSHDEIAAAFRRAEVFYCYDEMTLYAQYAVLCGCPTVVVPGPFFDRHAAYVAARPMARYGVSYGTGHLDHARATMHLVRGLLAARVAESRATVESFVALTRSRFGAGHRAAA